MIRIIALLVALSTVVACMDSDDTKPLTCAELGAGSDTPLLCTRDGRCTYENQPCVRAGSAAK